MGKARRTLKRQNCPGPLWSLDRSPDQWAFSRTFYPGKFSEQWPVTKIAREHLGLSNSSSHLPTTVNKSQKLYSIDSLWLLDLRCWTIWARNYAFGWSIWRPLSGRDWVAGGALSLLRVLDQRFPSLAEEHLCSLLLNGRWGWGQQVASSEVVSSPQPSREASEFIR